MSSSSAMSAIGPQPMLRGHEHDAALRRQPQRLSGRRGSVALLPEHRPHGDARRQQRLPGRCRRPRTSASSSWGMTQISGVQPPTGGAAGVVRGHEAEHRAVLPALASAPSSSWRGSHGRIPRRHTAAGVDRPSQPPRAPGDIPVHRPVPVDPSLRPSPRTCTRPCTAWDSAGRTGCATWTRTWTPFLEMNPSPSITSHPDAPGARSLPQRRRHGVMPAAGITGQYQYAHLLFLSAALASAAAPPAAPDAAGCIVVSR